MAKAPKIKKLGGEDADLIAQNVANLKTLFPEVFSEDKINFDRLREVLGSYINDNEEHYNFVWHGKRQALRGAQSPPIGTLRPVKSESVNWDDTQNLFIEGDNLEVLKLLQKSYYGKVKMIYIDPPYNTGSDFVYADDLKDPIKNYFEATGQLDDNGRLESTTAEDNKQGRFHTNWLNMMYPRLRLARNLLRDDGIIFISIDDNELDNLIKLCNEIFGEDNYINLISIKAKDSSGASGGGEDRRLKKNIEYLLCFSKSDSFRKFNDIYKTEPLSKHIRDRQETNRTFAYTKVLTKEGKESFVKTIKDGFGNDIEIYTVAGYEIKTVSEVGKKNKLDSDAVYDEFFDKIFTTENAQTTIRTRVHEALPEHDGLINIYYKPVSGRNKGIRTKVSFEGPAKRLVSYLNGVAERSNGDIIKKTKIGTLWDDLSWSNVSFQGGVPYPNGKKPVSLISRMLDLCFLEGEDGLVLDFFAGSCSTAHACFSRSLNNNQKISSISVQLPEKIKEKDKAKYYTGDNLPSIDNVCDIAKVRLHNIIRSFKKQASDKGVSPDLGLRIFKLDSSNLKAWDTHPENLETSLVDAVDYIKQGRDDQDLLFEVMLKYGLDLTAHIEEYIVSDNKKIYSIDYGKLVVCLDTDITVAVAEAIAEMKTKLSPENMQVVLRDEGFSDDVAKANTIMTLRERGIDDIKSL